MQYAAIVVYHTGFSVWWPQWSNAAQSDWGGGTLPCNTSVWMIPNTFAAEFDF